MCSLSKEYLKESRSAQCDHLKGIIKNIFLMSPFTGVILTPLGFHNINEYLKGVNACVQWLLLTFNECNLRSMNVTYVQ